MNKTQKGKNIRISDDHHQKLFDKLPRKINKGAWVEEAIDEKFERELGIEGRPEWPVKKETKVIQ